MDLFLCSKWNLSIRLWNPRGKTTSYVTLNKTNLWPDKVRDPSYSKGGWWKLENRESLKRLSFRRSQFYLRTRSNRGTRYNSYIYNTRVITFLQIHKYVHACYLSIALHGKNDFIEMSKNSARYKSDNFVSLSKFVYKT